MAKTSRDANIAGVMADLKDDIGDIKADMKAEIKFGIADRRVHESDFPEPAIPGTAIYGSLPVRTEERYDIRRVFPEQ